MARTAVKPADILSLSVGLASTITELRRDIHMHPELSFEERRTAALAADHLRKLGFTVEENVGGTGVVAELGNGSRTFGIRADMDALPIEEAGSCQYASRNKGVMHACGHDAHTAMALGAASLLSSLNAEQPFDGRVRMIFQPAEEMVDGDGKSGAVHMLDDGAAEGLDALVALHVHPQLPRGKVALRNGVLLAACDTLNITITGTGGHGAYPERAVDPLVIAAHVLQALQTVVSRRKSAIEPAVLTVGGMRTNTYRPNIIPDHVQMVGTLRYFDAETHERLLSEIARALSISESLGGGYELKVVSDNPVLFNDPQISNLVRFAATRLLGGENVVDIPPQLGADDFSFLSQQVPSCYFVLGTGRAGQPDEIHSASFDIDEQALPLGTAVLSASALAYFGALDA